MSGKTARPNAPWSQHYDAELLQRVDQAPADVLSAFGRQVTERPDAVALSYLGTPTTYAELDEQSGRLASWFARQGFAAGDRIAVALQNVPAFVVQTLAAWKIGAAICPVNPAYTADELGAILGDAAPRAVLCDRRQADVLGKAVAIADCGAVLMTVDSAQGQSFLGDDVFGPLPADSGAASLAEILADRSIPAIARAVPASDATALIMYTSGTTGRPKGAMHSHDSIAWAGNLFNSWIGHRPGSVILAIAPLFHITGFAAQMAASLMSGATLLLPYRMLAAQVLDLIRRERPTHTIGAITAFNALLSLPDSAREDFASFERVISGGAPIPPPLRDRIEAELGLVLYPGYGMTETAAASHVSAFVSTIPVDAASGALTIGVPLPGTEAMVVDDHDQPVAPGEPGELLLRGRHIMSGYWNREEETAETLRGGWMHTGDIVVMDEAGWFYVVDRKKDVIIASGYKVWPREVEDCLYAHPAVREAAVVGEPDPYRGETVKACVSLKPGAHADPAELAAHCREHLAPYKVPRSFEIMDELPKTVTGKIQRNVLRQKASTAR